VQTVPAPRPAPEAGPTVAEAALAGALHDGPVQSLLAALYGLQLADDAAPGSPAAAAALVMAREAVTQSLAELRRTMTALQHPPLLERGARSGGPAAHHRLEAWT
jgi:signal transduction histidine kinase